MVIIHVLILFFIALLSEVVFGSDWYQDRLWRLNLDREPFNCKSCLTFWLTFAYGWIFLFSLSWSLVVGFVFFTLSVEGCTEVFIDWIKKLKK